MLPPDAAGNAGWMGSPWTSASLLHHEALQRVGQRGVSLERAAAEARQLLAGVRSNRPFGRRGGENRRRAAGAAEQRRKTAPRFYCVAQRRRG